MSQFVKTILPAAASLALLICGGCAGRQAVAVQAPKSGQPGLPRSTGAPVGPAVVPAVLPQPPATLFAGVEPVPEPARTSRPPQESSAPEPTTANRTASLLKRRYIVSEPSPAQVIVKNPGTIPPPSLFEEAIALSKIRGRLKTQKALPPGVSERTTLKAGTVTIPMAGTLTPTEAAAAISAALGVDGVQRVNAVWDPLR
jgi:hypothetical protein